jgi:hypothetical protein
MTLVLDCDRSKVTLHTFAEGMLSAFAHDLDLTARVDRGDVDGERMTAYFPVSGLAVVGMRRHGKSDTHAPNAKDKDDIEDRVRREIFKGIGGDVVVVGRLDGRVATLEVRTAFGSDKVTTSVERREEDGRTSLRGACTLSLKALGTGKVSAPMGALRLRDGVEVEFTIVLGGA